MKPHRYRLVTIAAIAIATATVGWLYRSAAQVQASPRVPVAEKSKPKSELADIAAVRQSAELFAKAFNSGNAKAVAAFWTPDGEYTSPDGTKLHGRAAIEKAFVEFFKNSPRAHIDVKIDTIRLLGKHTALEEGTLSLKLNGEKAPGLSRYSVLHIREDDGWQVATVNEWVQDPSELTTLQDVEWLIGEWSAKTAEAELNIKYAWDEDKAYLRGRYTLKRVGRTGTSGTQIIGKNPKGGLRSWVFDAGGSFGESVWSEDDNRWVIEATGTLPDGSEVAAVNILIPLGPDAFTWQATERFTSGVSLPGTPPIRVTRVNKK